MPNIIIPKAKEELKEIEIPSYQVKRGNGKRNLPPLKIVIPIAVVLLILIALYVPPMLYSVPARTYQSTALVPDPVTLENFVNYKSTAIDLDFDGDGLKNLEEKNYQSGIYTVDSDGDGISDYMEVETFGTNPIVYDNGVIEFVKNHDRNSEDTIKTPFKIGDVIVWPDDYNSKARGSIAVLSNDRYQFSAFNGWVQFPEDIVSAYEVVDYYQKPLKKNDQNCYYISSAKSTVIVKVHKTEVNEVVCLSILGKDKMLPNNFGGKLLKAILPSRGVGLLTCKPATEDDFNYKEKEVVRHDPTVTTNTLNDFSLERFNRNNNTMGDLRALMKAIDDGNNVLVSFASASTGEVLVEVVGYTDQYNLLVCDPPTGDSLGIVQVAPISHRILDKNETISVYDTFGFAGCGFTSGKKDLIMMLATISPDGTINTAFAPQEPQTNPNIQEDPEDPIIPSDVEHPELELTGMDYTILHDYRTEDGKAIQLELEGVDYEEYLTHCYRCFHQYGFNCYFDDAIQLRDDPSSYPELTGVVYCNQDGDLLYLEFNRDRHSMRIRLEVHDYEHKIVVNPDYLLSDINWEYIKRSPIIEAPPETEAPTEETEETVPTEEPVPVEETEPTEDTEPVEETTPEG